MSELTPLALSEWESFYVIVGSSAGALTGLQFVVLTLIADNEMPRGSEAISAFGSPNVVHFCAALLVSAICSAPWHTLGPPGVAIALCGGFGLLYALTVLRRTIRQRDYKPVLEDWIWHAVLPILSYVALLDAGINLHRATTDNQYIVGGAVLMLVFIGIHNAWDTVMYITVQGGAPQNRAAAPTPAPAPAPAPPAASSAPTPPVPPPS
jgi:hypothetical protein